MMPSSIKKICFFFKKRKCARKIFIVFVTLIDLNKILNRAVTSGIASPKIWGEPKKFGRSKMFDFTRITLFFLKTPLKIQNDYIF